MPFRRSISLFVLATRVGQAKLPSCLVFDRVIHLLQGFAGRGYAFIAGHDDPETDGSPQGDHE